MEDPSDIQRQIQEMRSKLADKGALTAQEIRSTLDKLVQVAEKLTSQLSDVDRAVQAVEKLTSQLRDIETRMKQMEDEKADVRRKSGP